MAESTLPGQAGQAGRWAVSIKSVTAMSALAIALLNDLTIPLAL